MRTRLVWWATLSCVVAVGTGLVFVLQWVGVVQAGPASICRDRAPEGLREQYEGLSVFWDRPFGLPILECKYGAPVEAISYHDFGTVTLVVLLIASITAVVLFSRARRT